MDMIESNINDFLCNDAHFLANDKIPFSVGFKPDTFSVFDRIEYSNFIRKGEMNGQDWLRSHIETEIDRLQDNDILHFDDRDQVALFCYEQLETLLNYTYNGFLISSQIANQEIADISRKVIAYCIFRNPNAELYSHEKFNNFAYKIIPSIIVKKIEKQNLSLKDLLLFSVASGLIGLDLKGSVAASSHLTTQGITLYDLFDKPQEIVEEVLWERLVEITSKGFTIDYWEHFLEETSNRPCKLLWFLDDFIESFFDLFFIQKLLENTELLSIAIVPKNGRHGNDISFVDTIEILKLPIFSMNRLFIDQKRISICAKGPRMGTVNLSKLSSEIIEKLIECDCILVKGCRAYELIQGGLNKNCYFAYSVAREFSENETGFDARLSPLLFIRNTPKEYSYWGFKGRAIRSKLCNDGREIGICFSTVEEHERRKTIKSTNILLQELESLLNLQEIVNHEYIYCYYQEIRLVVNRILDITKEIYNKIAYTYNEIRLDFPSEMDRNYFNKLLSKARLLVNNGRLGDSNRKLLLLDVGTGSGRDLRYFRRFEDLKAIGIDNSPVFINMLSQLAQDGEIDPDSFYELDMRNLSIFNDSTFDIIRHNASLLHLPVTPMQIGVDEAISESFRVLKPYGLIYIWAKAGEGLRIIDTQEGLGERVFQLFTKELLSEILIRNGFKIISIEICYENRPAGLFEMISALAQKLL